MKRTIHFKNGSTVYISQEDLNSLVKAISSPVEAANIQCFSDGGIVYLVVRVDEIAYIC